VVNYHHRLPLTQAFGPGTLSSSDGQRFPVKGRSITARALSRYFARGQGIAAHTHVSDQHATFDTKVPVAAAPESHYVLDGMLGNATDLPIAEHATDTHGATLANFALFDLVGKQLSPRIRDLGKITLYRTGPRAAFTSRYPHAGPLLTRRLNTELLSACWDELLRVAASVKYGHATAALVVGKLCSSKRQQNALTAAIKEYGALRRTIFAARYPVDEAYRRRIARQLNKGENLHALRRELAYAGEGAVRRRYHEQQTEQMWCLTLATTRSSPGPPSTTGWRSRRCAAPAEQSTRRSWRTCGPATTKTSTSTAPTWSTSTGSWQSSTPTGIGRCASHRSGERQAGTAHR
jgi:TnpA family transposase